MIKIAEKGMSLQFIIGYFTGLVLSAGKPFTIPFFVIAACCIFIAVMHSESVVEKLKVWRDSNENSM